MWWNRKKDTSTPEAQPDAMDRADAALEKVQDSQIKARGVLFYLKQQARENHFSQDFIRMVEKGRS